MHPPAQAVDETYFNLLRNHPARILEEAIETHDAQLMQRLGTPRTCGGRKTHDSRLIAHD